jgi:predicted transposase/invertase (TIGR01784 family)
MTRCLITSANFWRKPGLLPFAVLSQTNDRIGTLQQVAQQINQIADSRTQSNLAASTYILAGLLLEQEAIQQILRRDIMQESVTYQAIKAEGKSEGRAEGSREALREVAMNLLREGMEVAVVARVTGLSAEQVQQLAEEIANRE